MLLNLQRYNLSIVFVTGKENVVADALSRAPEAHQPREQSKKWSIFKVFKEIESVDLSHFLSVSDSRLNEIMEETEKDSAMQRIIHYVQHGWPASADQVPDDVKIYFGYRKELSTQNGIVFRADRILVPHSLRRKLVDRCHVSHNGIEATLKLARANLFWPGMSSQIKDVVASCNVCAKFAASQQNPPMQSHSIPVHQFQMVSMDVFFGEYEGRKRNFLVTVDHYSDFFEVDVLKDLTPQSVISVCQQNFARHGTPQRVLTDNGTNFVNRHVAKFAMEWDFELVTSAPHHQQANGKSEAAVKIAKRLLVKANETGTDFWYALLHWRNIPNKIGSSPSARLFSRSTRCGVPSSIANLRPRVVENVPEAIAQNRRKIKYQYDKKARILPELKTGSPVFVQLTPETSKVWTPATISNRMTDRSYNVVVDGKEYRRSLVHIKPRHEPATSPVRRTPSDPRPSSSIQESEPDTSAPSCQVENSVGANSSPTTMQPSPVRPALMEPAPASTRRTAPRGESHVGTPSTTRPRRQIRIPERLKDFDLN